MSLSSAMSTAVSGLTAESLALSTISKNIANASTTAYKTSATDFQSLLTGYTASDTSGGSVTAKAMQNLSQQGQIASTSTGTNIAIDGSGFFVVASSAASPASDFAYTRNGSFTTDNSGNLVNDSGYYLEGFPTDAAGKVLAANSSDLSNLRPINLNTIGGTAKATTQIKMAANMPANAAIGAAFSTSTTSVDSLGVSHTIGQTWTKTAANTWTLALANPVLTSDPTTTSGAVSPSSVTVTFDTSGVLASTNPTPVTLTLSGLSTGAADSTIDLNLGTVGKTDGVTQFSSSSTTPAIGNPSFTEDGAVYGQLTGVTIDGKGLVTASFDNGVKLPVYQIPLATFPNPNGLSAISGTVFSESQTAGNVSLKMPGDSSAGAIQASALEGSTTDIAGEFNKMIVAQQAYSAASQVVSTVKNMFDTLSTAIR
jgi:flagellar hook protein FlgE